MGNDTIAISGLPGSGSTTIGKLLAKKLSYSHFSPGQLFKDIAKGEIKGRPYYQDFKKICDKYKITVPEIKSTNDSHAATELWKTDFGKSDKFHNALDGFQSYLAERGKIVLDGKISVFIIKDASLKVWINASLDKRAQRTSKRDSISFHDAKEKISAREQTESSELMKIYGFDYRAQKEIAHISIDTSEISPQEAVDEILDFLKQTPNKID